MGFYGKSVSDLVKRELVSFSVEFKKYEFNRFLITKTYLTKFLDGNHTRDILKMVLCQ